MLKDIYEKYEKNLIVLAFLFMAFLIYQKYLASNPLCFEYQLALTVFAYILIASDVIYSAFKCLFVQHRMTEQFLMMVATFGAFALGDLPEALAVMIFYKIGELFEDYAKGRAHKDISHILSLRPNLIRVIKDGKEQLVKAKAVKIGDVIRVLKGESVGIDGKLLDKTAAIDTKALTGESEPYLYTQGQIIPSGCINQGEVITLEVTTLHKNSSITRLLNLIEDAMANKSKPEDLIRRFSIYYTPLVVFSAIVLALVPLFVEGAKFSDWIDRALVFLVVSCPCALVISVPLTFFSGIGALSRLGVIVKGSIYIETLSKIKAIAFDKTGTLTSGNFKVVKVTSVSGDTQKLIDYAYSLEAMSTHPIALSISQHAKDNHGKKYDLSEVQETSGLGISAKIKDQVIRLGKYEYIASVVGDFDYSQTDKTTIFVSEGNTLLGQIELSDSLKENAQSVILDLKALKLKTFLISGDKDIIVKSISEKLKLDKYFSMQSPHSKLERFKELQKDYEPVAYVGDGLNDAPVIASANVGIAMGQIGSKSAIESSDVVVLNDNLSSIEKCIRIAKKTYKLALTNMFLVMAVKFSILLLGALGIANIWLAIFGDVGVLILAVLNAMRAMRFYKI